MFRIFKRNKSPEILQQKENRNRAVLNFLIASGFSMSPIRKALMVLNEAPMGVLRTKGASHSSVTRTMQNVDHNPVVMKIASERLGLAERELFPEAVNDE